MDKRVEVVLNVTICLKYDIVDENTTMEAYRTMWENLSNSDMRDELVGMLPNRRISNIEDFTVEEVKEV